MLLSGLIQVSADDTACLALLGFHGDEAVVAQGVYQFFGEERVAAGPRLHQLGHGLRQPLADQAQPGRC